MLFKKCWPFAVNASLVFITILPASAFDNTGTIKSLFDTVHSGLDLIVPGKIEKHGLCIRLRAGFGSVPDYLGSDDYRLKNTAHY